MLMEREAVWGWLGEIPVSALNPSTKWLFTENTEWWRDNLSKIYVPLLSFPQSFPLLTFFGSYIFEEEKAHLTPTWWRGYMQKKWLKKILIITGLPSWHSCSHCQAFCKKLFRPCSCLVPLPCLMWKSPPATHFFPMRHIVWTPVGCHFDWGGIEGWGRGITGSF